MTKHKKLSECPSKLAKYLREANYLLIDNFKFKRGSFFLSDKARQEFDSLASLLSDECLEDYNWIKQLLNKETITLEIPKEIDSKAKEGSLMGWIYFEEQALRRNQWREVYKLPADELYEFWCICPNSELYKIVRNSVSSRFELNKIIKWNKFTPVRKRLGFSANIEADEDEDDLSTDFYTYKIENNILFQVSHRRVIDYLIKERIDISRILKCEDCKKIFWAKNINSVACSKLCQNNVRQKRYYQQNKETLKEARRQRYAHLKRQKELKEKKEDGTL